MDEEVGRKRVRQRRVSRQPVHGERDGNASESSPLLPDHQQDPFQHQEQLGFPQTFIPEETLRLRFERQRRVDRELATI